YAMVACVGAAQLGVMGGLDGPFFYGIYTLPPLVMVLPCSLGRRIWITAALLIPFVLAYFLPHQEYLDHPFLHIPAIYLVAITVVSVLLGDWIYGLTRDRFLFALRIDEQRELLARHNASLAEEVEIKASAVERLSGELETVRIDERSDLARALHDDLGQLIAGARMELGNIERALSGEADAGDKDLSFLYEIIESLAHSTRHIVGALRAEGPGHAEGLEESIESLVSPLRERAALEITTAVFLDEVPPPATREAIYRTVQEAMTNILKHANASRADIQVHARGANEVVVVVSDDGGGFDTNGELGGWGLRGIRERLGSLEGTLEIRSDETGTRLEARMPIDR
ncbi:MAG: histidine kinase, partial [Myxococcales bacterium]|nr:histidine kinase [Myxococcales bacterium]